MDHFSPRTPRPGMASLLLPTGGTVLCPFGTTLDTHSLWWLAMVRFLN